MARIEKEEYDTGFVEAAWERPQGILDVIGMSVRLWRRNLGLIIRLTLWPSIFTMIGSTGIQCCIAYAQALITDAMKIVCLIVLAVVSISIVTVSQIVLGVRLGTLVRLSNGFSNDLASATEFCQKRMWSLVAIGVISSLIGSTVCGVLGFMFAIGLGVAAAAGPAGAVLGACWFIVTGFVFVVAMTMYCLYWYLLLPVYACEDISLFSVIGRSTQLLFQHFPRVLGFGFVLYVVVVAVSTPFTLISTVAIFGDTFLRQTAGSAQSLSAAPSFVALVFVQFWESLTQLILRPISALAFGLLYLNLRHRADGLDLRRRLKLLKELYLPASS